MNPWILRGVAVMIATTTLWFCYPYFASAKSQSASQQRHLIKLAAGRDWPAVQERIAADYKDQWSLNRDEAVELGKQAFGGFFTLNIEWRVTEVTVNGKVAQVRGIIRIKGAGAGASQAVMRRVNEINEPWVFTWRSEGWKPQDWKLVSMKNAAIEEMIPAELR